MSGSSEKPKPDWWSLEKAERLRKIGYDFHVQAFGEEMARINHLPLEQRRAEVARIYDHAKAKGVKFDKSAEGFTR